MAASTGTVSFFVVYDWSKALTAERTEPSEARLRMTAPGNGEMHKMGREQTGVILKLSDKDS